MKREVIFRGKLSHSGKWIWGSLLKIDNKYHIVTESDMYEDGHHIRQESDRPTWVEPDTLGQYTGLKGKNGVEIYEGDVVKTQFSSTPFGIVAWHDNGYFFIDTSFGEWRRFSDDYISIGCFMDKQIDGERVQLEVIGNIYDNPEYYWNGNESK